MKITLVLAVAILLLASTAQAEAAQADGHLWTLRSELELENVGSTEMEEVRVRIPLLAEVTGQGEVVDEQFSLPVEDVVESEDGSREGLFLLPGLAPGENITLTFEYLIDPQLASSATGEGEELGKDEAEPVSDDISAAARRVVRNSEGRDVRFAALQEFTHNHISYDLESPWRNGDAEQALKQAEGVCEDYALLLVALANAADIPARTVYGYVRGTNSESWTRHTWVEYLTEDGQWMGADPAFSRTPGLADSIYYVAQWYEDRPVRVTHTGGRIAGSLTDTVGRIEPDNSE